ncbi:MAG: LacI family DNA-binding transcriptional regulator [Aerococcus sp.]|nr:LacI family DNA-binding transcriptional regulator [Aerococcus sp.]
MATMNDVAKLAGVSRGTVSNYINGGNVKPASQKRIQSAIDQLHYVPNTAARQLKTSRSDLVVFILPTTRTPLFAELTYKVQRALQQQGMKMILCNSNNDVEQERDYIQMAKMQKAAGIITMSYSNSLMEAGRDLPVVSIEKQISKEIPCVSADNYQGGYIAARALHEAGAEHLLMVTRTTEKTRSNFGLRVKGFVDFCQEKHIAHEVFEVHAHEAMFYVKLEQELREKFKMALPYDGIFAVADQYADFMENILHSLNIQVPQQVQIIGFDGGKMYVDQPRHISSIRQPVDAIAECCVKQLMAILHGKDVPSKYVTLPVNFVKGQTTC